MTASPVAWSASTSTAFPAFFDANDPSYGVWQFKTRFGGFVEELPGKFTLPVDGLRFGVSEAAHKLLHR